MKKKHHPSCLPLLLPFFFLLLSLHHGTAEAQNTTKIIDVGVILDLDTWVGKMGQSCISMALSDFYATHNYTTRLNIHIRNSKNDIVTAASTAIDLMKNFQVQAILGPQRSAQAEFVADIGNKTQVPVISFSAASPFLSSIETPYFVRTAQSDSSQVKPISAIIQAFGWREVVPIYEDTEYGRGIVPFLTDALQVINVNVPYRCVISPSATDDQILKELYKLKTMQTRVFVVHMSSSIASRLFLKAKEAGMMDKGFAWIISYELTNILASLDSSVIDSMQGVLGVQPYVPVSKQLENFKTRWKIKFRQDNPDIDRIELDLFGLWAYDSTWALAMAAEQVGYMNVGFNKLDTRKNSSDPSDIGVSQVGPKLLQAITRTRFTGLSGKFRLVNGEQPSNSAFKIVNVVGKGEKEIGFWTPTHGISRKLNKPHDKKMYSIFKDELGTIVWPGDTSEVPKGWKLSTSGKKLKIGVPVKNRLLEFVKVETDSLTKAPIVTGFCIDVFKAVIDLLPYAVPYEFVPFKKVNNNRTGTSNYNDLVQHVYLQTQDFDAVVGDITILANRTLYVDFTLPYTESGVSMVVPIKGDERKSTWIFLKPLKMDLWLTTGAFFIITGLVIWLLEHRINVDFRGPPHRQVGMVIWFSFSTLVFAHKEKILSNLSRFVMIIWVFVVLVLTSSYQASLTSMLTVQQLQPTITDLQDIVRNGQFIGYQRGSFVTGLMDRVKFDPSKLRPYNSLEEYDDALSRGSRYGGVAAIVDEIPYIKLFLAKYCTKYTMVGPTYKTSGFGFGFRKNSPLVPDVSRAILNIIEEGKMTAIERKWFNQNTDCPEQGKNTSDSLTLDSFRGLFLIAGVSSGAAVLIFLFVFLCEHRDILNSEGSVRQKVGSMIKEFDHKKDISSHTEHKERNPHEGINMSTVQSPRTSISNHGEGIFTEEERSISTTEPRTPDHGLFTHNRC
uniref:Glutamate receptor n=1 Tax=Nelumbo nucifera TaxID=4432 RepID=A0A822ZMB8_NELNU|nr:TPA_asm: hypothetical protein HUJ06_003850 [Nelumbo nucifera]